MFHPEEREEVKLLVVLVLLEWHHSGDLFTKWVCGNNSKFTAEFGETDAITEVSGYTITCNVRLD